MSGQNLSISVDTLESVNLSAEDIAMCEANVTWVTVEKSAVGPFGQEIRYELGGNVPENVGFLKFTKYLHKTTGWLCQGARINMQDGGHLGNSLKKVDQSFEEL